MIHWRNLLQLVGFFLIGLATVLVLPAALAVSDNDSGRIPFIVTALLCAFLGVLLAFGWRLAPLELRRREGILLVVAAWLVASVFGALPFYFSPAHFPTYSDAFFESVSGFTTTGATVLSDIESLPRSLLLWRALTHWVGGMGIILLGIAILPLLGSGGMQLYRAEFSGARSEKLSPRIAETAAALWKIYVSFSIALYLALRLAGMGPFDAVCHSFSTMATGGFSTRNLSIESFGSPLIEAIVIVFMITAGLNFTLHYRIFVERRVEALFDDFEARYYLLLLAAAALAVMLSLWVQPGTSPGGPFRKSLFQVVSIMTTTGFSSTDFEQWSSFAQLVLLALMFAGGCTGSTAGGLKVSRLVLLFNVVGREFRQMIDRRGVFAVRMGGSSVSESTVRSLLNLVYLSFLVNFVGCLLLTATGVDILTSISAVAACMFNIGPGLGSVGPSENYGHLPALAKWVLSCCMLAGRLEFYTLLVIVTPHFWRK